MKGIRITGGRFKGRTIAATRGGPARFTSGKVREAIFDIAGPMEGLRILDLFAGTGSFTVEALSRGAASVTAVEQDRRTVALLKENLETLSIDKDCLVLNMDVRYAVPMLHRQGKVFDLLFADPPYEMGYVAATFGLLANNPLFNADSVLVFEHSKREDLDSLPEDVLTRGYVSRTRRYGDTVLSIITCGGE
jgi:16S rRNA (guanine(966)-N(2))-methyltransferase RsmD